MSTSASRRTTDINKTTSIKVNRNIWKEAKIEAVRRDLQLQAFVELAIRKELKR